MFLQKLWVTLPCFRLLDRVILAVFSYVTVVAGAVLVTIGIVSREVKTVQNLF